MQLTSACVSFSSPDGVFDILALTDKCFNRLIKLPVGDAGDVDNATGGGGCTGDVGSAVG